LIGGEQLADRAILPPAVAMWMANAVLGTIGLIMTWRTAQLDWRGHGRTAVRRTASTRPQPARPAVHRRAGAG
jgi:hypothetical protein